MHIRISVFLGRQNGSHQQEKQGNDSVDMLEIGSKGRVHGDQQQRGNKTC